jgi:hypothetical protein
MEAIDRHAEIEETFFEQQFRRTPPYSPASSAYATASCAATRAL